MYIPGKVRLLNIAHTYLPVVCPHVFPHLAAFCIIIGTYIYPHAAPVPMTLIWVPRRHNLHSFDVNLLTYLYFHYKYKYPNPIETIHQ